MAAVKPATPIIHTTSTRAKWGSLKDLSSQRKLFDQVARKLNINRFEDWYSCRTSQIARAGANSILLDHYDRSLSKALQAIYPEYDWKPWKFIRTPHRYWSDHKHVGEYLVWLADQLGVKTLDDWYNVSRAQIIHSGGKTLLNKFGGLYNLITTFYPDHNWKQFMFRNSKSRNMSKAQLHLYSALCKLFPNHKILVDYRLGGLTYEDSQATVELDIYIPSLSLAFEYQGEQHYHFTVTYGDPSKQQAIDAKKIVRCAEAGITLIQIPYWWNRQRSSLVGTILKYNPSIVPHIASTQQYLNDLQAIPQQIPAGTYKAPDVGKVPMVQILHSSRQIADKNPHEWWMLEVKPGIPCLWDAEKKVLLSQSTLSPLPQTLQEQLETLGVNVIGILHNGTFQVIDIQQDGTYEQRYDKLASLLSENLTLIQAATKQQYDGRPLSSAVLIPKDTSNHTHLLFTEDESLLQAGSVAHYRLALGPSKGTTKCRGCYRQFKDRNEARIEIRGTFTPFQHTTPVPVIFRVCFDLKCLYKFQKRLEKKPTARMYVPPFHNWITIPEPLQNTVGIEDMKKQNVHFVVETK